ncbi:7948305e-e42f-4195-b52c-dbff204e2231 [Thermothielavioides terrestris]|uniref:Uncharacterized protein n=2 Tax=Thermothielavioides terrestris TaxID=2587410 RepID=G2R6W4_THETT|nr:uncharacterized protein THITE_2090054 [Thermothielavioides terrestris NRRL 8126]AEO68542.1 hypothetical protein THITE_2090054 [Thermothielavioides terrestris NRRL 8126]SPQ24183.1 7948305e-e42f-4195-b52c-dbff204e2231 [Thermothielavioides terrestris]
MDGKKACDGSRVLALINGFGVTLTQHLGDEIPPSPAFAMTKGLGTAGELVCFSNLDLHYEDNT